MFKLAQYFSLIFLLTACATYAPPKIDKETGSYATSIQLPSEAILEERTDADPGQYRFVYLTIKTNDYPKRFEFFVREALVGSGFKHILDRNEMVDLISSTEQLSGVSWLVDSSWRSKLSQKIGPILQVYFQSEQVGDSRRNVHVIIKDMYTGDILLEINHSKKIWWDVDTEAHYPVINTIKQWVDSCNKNHMGGV